MEGGEEFLPGGLTGMDADRALLPAWVRNEMKTVETEIKYSGYLDQQRRSMEKMRKAERRGIPEWFDYKAVSGIEPGDAGDAGAGEAADAGAGEPDCGGDSGGGEFAACLHRDTGAGSGGLEAVVGCLVAG